MRYWFGWLIFGVAYTWRGLFSEFYGISQNVLFRQTRGLSNDSAVSRGNFAASDLATRGKDNGIRARTDHNKIRPISICDGNFSPT